MKLNDLIYKIKPPCPKCPYTLGHVKFIKAPCLECKANNYRTYEELVKGKGRQFFDKSG